MSSTAAPFGLRASWHPSGQIRPENGTIASGYAVNIFKGSPIGYVADGSIAMAPAGGTGLTGAVGAFHGVEYNPTATAPRVVSNMWPASQAATAIVAWFNSDPLIRYEVQGSGSIAQTAMGAQFDWSTNDTNAGNTVTGLSSVSLNIASGAANAGLRVVGITPAPDNVFGDAFTIVQVNLSEHQFVATIAQI